MIFYFRKVLMDYSKYAFPIFLSFNKKKIDCNAQSTFSLLTRVPQFFFKNAKFRPKLMFIATSNNMIIILLVVAALTMRRKWQFPSSTTQPCFSSTHNLLIFKGGFLLVVWGNYFEALSDTFHVKF